MIAFASALRAIEQAIIDAGYRNTGLVWQADLNAAIESGCPCCWSTPEVRAYWKDGSCRVLSICHAPDCGEVVEL